MTVTGLDHPGILAAVADALAANHANVLNISQTIMDEYFTMIVEIEFDESNVTVHDIQRSMTKAGEEARLVIRVQAEDLFRAMNRL